MYRHYFFTALMLWIVQLAQAQVVTTDPAFPRADQPVTIRFNVNGTTLNGYSKPAEVWLWAWLPTNCTTGCDAPTNVNPATSAQEAARATRISTNPDVYEITITPTTFFNKPADQIKRIGVKLKSRSWDDNIQTDNDRFFDIYSGGFTVAFQTPTSNRFFVNTGEQISIQCASSEKASLTLRINDVVVASATDALQLAYNHTVTETSGSIDVDVQADNGSIVKTSTFQYMIRTPTTIQQRPAGVVDGINYDNDPTRVTLSLLAPGKSTVYVRGEFNDWQISSDYQMKKDGEHFWITLDQLVPGQEYAFQYVVDESLYIADPYADKLVFPSDAEIPASSYPNLKTFPAAITSTSWYFNCASVLQTNQPSYNWKVKNFQRPDKKELVIYELLIRDFFGSADRTYKNLADTVSYFKRLGVNAVQLMPIMEFNDNDSWGYNPIFMFAPDKYYGAKNDLKAFIDKCHEQGIAVILDIALNHQNLPNPYVMMDFDFSAMKPTANNKWFNVNATHPYNVFYDMNHESAYTKQYLDTINYYWLNEYKVDGFRFDLSKGFTQKNNPNDVGAWSAYDASRIAILKRMADKIWSHTPEAYVILEHFADNAEEIELAAYRADEGKGMMLWGNLNYNYSQNTMGYASGSDISTGYYATRGWPVPHLITYMESHDEERVMYRNKNFGYSSSTYDIKSNATALTRMRAASAMFFTLPGPKMIWEFGEMGYDQSINRCTNGTISNDCRVTAKPVLWTYLQDTNRRKLFNQISDLLRLRNQYAVFRQGSASFNGTNAAVKQVTIRNSPYTASPANASQMNVHLVANFGVAVENVNVNFPHNGTWYEYHQDGKAFEVNGALSLAISPGRYRLFTDVQIPAGFKEDADEVVTSVEPESWDAVSIYPNPTTGKLNITARSTDTMTLMNAQGANVSFKRTDDELDLTALPAGLYILQIQRGQERFVKKIIKQ